uniref:MULE transposase domain-containing protein n=1 Tax=Setaria italica TaxID=4555 RepID=K3YC99_SETIT
MDCCVRVFYGGSVRKEDGTFQDMEEELEWFDEPPSFNDVCVRLNAKFGGDFTLKGRVLQGFNVPMPEVVVENGYRMHGCINNDFDVNKFEQEEEEQEEEDRIGDVVASDSEESDDDEGGTDGMPQPVHAMPVPVHAMALPLPAEVLHAMPAQGRLVTDLAEGSTPYDSWGRISQAQQYVPPPPYIETKLIQLREMNIPFSGVPNYRDASMKDMMCRKSLCGHENEILSKGMIFNTMSEMKLFLQDYVVYHHRLYTGKENHQQPTAHYLARRILGLVDENNDISVSSLQLSISGFVKYDVKYGKAWRAKQVALAIRWDSWEEAYNRVPRILCAMHYYDPGLKWFVDTRGMYFRDSLSHVLYHVFWSFAQTQHAFQFCQPIVLVDGTFLTGKYRGTLMMAAVVDPEDQIVPMAFALAEGENNESWSWFMRLLCVQVLGPSRTVCLISDHHPGILNAVDEHIDGFPPPIVHRWCMRHFAANFWQRQRKKEVCDKVKALCCVHIEHQFKEIKRELDKMVNEAGKAWFEAQMEHKAKWALAYDEGGFRYGIMTTNLSESLNRVFTGCNKYFVKRWKFAQRNLAEHGRFGKAETEHLKEVEELANVRGKGGTRLGGKSYGGRNYRVDLEKVECSCNVPQIIYACPLLSYDHRLIWEKRFEPYLDLTQWPSYHGYDYLPHPDQMKVVKGRRRKKRLKGDIDVMRGYGEDITSCILEVEYDDPHRAHLLTDTDAEVPLACHL